MKHIIYILVLAVLAGSCEKMEDTHKYGEEHKIRYIGKRKNLRLEAGWKRFRLTWENTNDPVVDKIKILWKHAGVKIDSATIDAAQTSYTTGEVFENKDYEFNLYALDKEKKHSLKAVVYGRPFTEGHESLAGHNAIQRAYFYVGNSFLLVLNEFLANQTAKMVYYQNGQKQERELSRADYEQKYLVFDNIDPNKEVQLEGVVLIDKCFDPVPVSPYLLARDEKGFYPDFEMHVKERYQIDGWLGKDFINNREVLELDADLLSLQDILHFPKLKRLLLGANRFMHPDYVLDALARLEFREISLFAIRQLHRIKGVTVGIYNDHYGIADELPFAERLGNPALPPLAFFDMQNWTISTSSEVVGFDSNPGHLLDNDANTAWQPMPVAKNEVNRQHEIIIDMKESKEIGGFLVAQFATDEDSKREFFSWQIQVYQSENKRKWTQAHPLIGHHTIGKGRGERTLIRLPGKIRARYLKLVVNDGLFGDVKSVSLADFIPFK